VSLSLGEQKLVLDAEAVATRPALVDYVGKQVVLGIRPEDLEDAALVPDAPSEHRLKGTVELREALGSELQIHFTVPGAKAAYTEDVQELATDVGDERAQGEGAGALVVGRFDPHAKVSEGEPVEAVVDTRSLHFFEPDTGLGIYDHGDKGGTT
jgi:multiple sugar transport system ATP-binding protein